jgi:large subunit ribosomal protein L6
MSRIGKKPVAVPAGVNFTVAGRTITVKGPQGTLSYEHRPEITVQFDDKEKKVVVTRGGDAKSDKAYHGLTRALINNMIIGVTQGYKKELEVVGVGWTAKLQGKKLTLNVGFADPRELDIPAGLKVEVALPKINISGADKQMVGEFAARVRAQRKPEPYNGKGIKYTNETIIRKAGKAFAGGSA